MNVPGTSIVLLEQCSICPFFSSFLIGDMCFISHEREVVSNADVGLYVSTFIELSNEIPRDAKLCTRSPIRFLAM